MEKDILSNKYSQMEGYLWFVLPVENFKKLPGTVEVNGEELHKKNEFHITIINRKKVSKDIASISGRDPSEVQLGLGKLLDNYIKNHEIKFLGFTGELKLAEKDGRLSLVALCNVKGVEDYFKLIEREYGYLPPLQPFHVSLYTKTGLAVGIDSDEEMDDYPTVVHDEIQAILKLI